MAGREPSHYHPGVEDLEVELDAQGQMLSATVAIEKLQALNPNLWAYFASVTFYGDQTMDVLIDTGSAGMGIPIEHPGNWSGPSFEVIDPSLAHAERVRCDDPRCRGACDQPSSTHKCGPHGGSCVTVDGQELCSFAWLYGDGSSAQGVLMSSPVELGGLRVTSTYGGIIRATDTFFEMPRGGGIMGMAFGGYSLCDSEYTCFPPLIDDIITQRQLDNKFAICANGNDASLIIGRGDARLQAEPIKYVPLQQPYGFYWVRVLDVTVNGESLLQASPSSPSRLRSMFSQAIGGRSGTLALVDTGNSATYFPEAIFDGFKQRVQARLGQSNTVRTMFPRLLDNTRSIFNGYAVYIAPDILRTMPKVEIVLDNGLIIPLTPEQYTAEFRTDAIPVPLRALKIARGSRFVLGQTVLNHMYMEIDREHKTIGFAPSAPGCDASR